MSGGRPRLYQDHASFADKVEEYFALVREEDRKPTLAGMALHLGFEDRESITTYATYGPDFSRTVNRARMRIEDDRQQSLLSKDKFTPGIALDLQNNHGWRNKTETELTGAKGGPILSETKLDVSGLTDEQLRALASIRVPT